MKNYFLIFVIAVSCVSFLAFMNYHNYKEAGGKPPKWIEELVKNSDLEIVYGDRLPYINPYGSYGSPFIKGTIYTNHKVYNKAGNWNFKSLKFIVLLCRKQKNKSNKQIDSQNDYNYFLVFAITGITNPKIEDENRGYKIDDILEIKIPVGMHFLQGELEIDLSEFICVGNKNIKIKKGKILQNSWITPVVIPYEKGRQILIYYEDNWFLHTLQEW